MKNLSYNQAIEIILSRDQRYSPAAYNFIRESLSAAAEKLQDTGSDRPHHLTAAELMDGIRDRALEQFGQMALTVLREWGVNTTRDFGQIVFNLVDIGMLRRSDDDKIEDFDEGYDFHEAFRAPFEPRAALEMKHG